MADSVVHIGENSPEHVAYVLMKEIGLVENFVLHNSPGGSQKPATREWILNTYLQCWRVTHGEKPE